MTLADKICKELECANPQLLKDIQTFTCMKIPRKLLITDPPAYEAQIKRLDQLRKDNEADLTDFVNKNMGNVIEALIQDLVCQPTKPSYPTTTQSLPQATTHTAHGIATTPTRANPPFYSEFFTKSDIN